MRSPSRQLGVTLALSLRPSAVGQASPAGKTRLILLGTAGGPRPRMNRTAPAQVILVNSEAYVVDCGNGVAIHLVRAGVNTIRQVFVTHHHRTITRITATCCCWPEPPDFKIA